MSTNDGLWYVKTSDGDVDRMTVDQLDEAFNSGRIDENVMVLPADGSRWARLGELAGIEPRAGDELSGVPTSLRPVSMNATDELEAPFARRTPRMGVVFGAVVAVIAVVGGGLAIKNSGVLRSFGSSRVVAPAPPPATAAPPPATTVALPPPEPAAVVAAAATPADTAATAPTSDVTNAKAAPGKGKQDKSKPRKKTRGSGAH